MLSFGIVRRVIVARETVSEKTLKKSNHYYYKRGMAHVTKNEPHLRIAKRRLMFSSSGGLDYSGIENGGKHISFELKETEKSVLPLGNIRMVQVDIMQRELKFGADAFLLVYFKKLNEWYRLNHEDLARVIDSPSASIPLRYFRAFGYMLPSHRGFPEYLSPEAHPTRNESKKDYPSWMPKARKRKPVTTITTPNPLDLDARRERIINAIGRGCKNARRKEIEIDTILKNRRGTYNNGPERRHSCKDEF